MSLDIRMWDGAESIETMVIDASCKEMEKLKWDKATRDVNWDTEPRHN